MRRDGEGYQFKTVRRTEEEVRERQRVRNVRDGEV
jgi:hypothetical protein